ncbi:nitrilase-related carbon-nitrogen hydrolase [Paenibacillus beijingensis]|uniref:Nitrilase n=1 Tax=Paenibacillus beijingensis TaxID=1126833 RepID=A0A0D5NQZ2_9BACL|nr:nitrilase-related carbon-nitrogen hydrolase [Paenibacillus beijingensis]AJY77323.1 nitrilase [Paenibacillus beijingensis]
MNTSSEQRPLMYKVAAVQFNPVQGDAAGNRRRMAKLLQEAAENGAMLTVFPEMASSGYVWNDREEISPFVETIPGSTTEALQAVAQKYRCYAAVGLPEVDAVSGAYYNSAVLIGPDGVAGKYRKTHLFAADPRWAREGNDGIPVFATEIGNIALLICMDAMYFEPARIAALQQADIIAFPTNWVGAGNNEPSNTWRLRAKENGVYWVASNRSDTERGARFTGGSAVIEPDGGVQHSLVSGEGIVYGTVRLDAAARQQLTSARKPEAYQELLLSPYLWKEGETLPIGAPAPFEIIVFPLEKPEFTAGLPDRLHALLEETEGRLTTGNRLYVLPEIQVRDPADSAQAERLLAEVQLLAIRYQGYMALSIAEHTGAVRDISAYMIGPEQTVGRCRQVHRTVRERTDDKPRLCTFELPFARVGLLTEHDAEYPESYRVLAKQGADIIAVSGTGMGSGGNWMKRIWAFENDAVIAYALPSEAAGSLLFLHRQLEMEGGPGSGDEPLIGRFDPDMTAAARSRPFMRRTKPHLYDRLVMKLID